MRFVSLFSGIEAASVAWGPLGWEAVAFAEIEPFPCAVLKYRFPDVPNLGDVTKIDWREFIERSGPVDVICGGSPCQSFSIAGGREGLDGESRLMFEYIRACDEVRPPWIIWENVPGVFSIDGGRAFAILLDALKELGYGLSWRTLDSQFFGVAQRRARCWLVGHLGDMRSAAVLFDADSLRGNTKSSREKREELTRAAPLRPSIGFKPGAGAGAGTIGLGEEVSPTLLCDAVPAVMPFDTGHITSPANHSSPKFGDPNGTICAGNHPPAVVIDGCLNAWDVQSKHIYDESSVCGTLCSGTNEGMNIQPSVLQRTYCMAGNLIDRSENAGPAWGSGVNEDVCFTLNTADRHAVAIGVGSNQPNAPIDSDAIGTLTVKADLAYVVQPDVETILSDDVAGTLCARDYKGPNVGDMMNGKVVIEKAYTLKTRCGSDTYIKPDGKIGTAGKGALVGEETAFTLSATQDQTLIAPIKGDTTPKVGNIGDPAFTLRRGPEGGSIDYVADCSGYVVRRLTPRECERLQGFPDGWTDIEYRGKPAADGPRYKALGNSWAVPCARWIGERIEYVEAIAKEEAPI